MTKNDTTVVNEVEITIPQQEVKDTVSIAVYSEHMADWDESDAHKVFIANNTIGLKTGHDNKARYYVTRAPLAVVTHAHCNQFAIERELIVTIFTVKLESPDKERIRKLYTLGYGAVINGSRECYTLTGGLRRTRDNTFVLSEQDTFHDIVNMAADNAAIEGITDEVFSNALGRVTVAKSPRQLQAETANAADSVTRSTSW